MMQQGGMSLTLFPEKALPFLAAEYVSCMHRTFLCSDLVILKSKVARTRPEYKVGHLQGSEALSKSCSNAGV